MICVKNETEIYRHSFIIMTEFFGQSTPVYQLIFPATRTVGIEAACKGLKEWRSFKIPFYWMMSRSILPERHLARYSILCNSSNPIKSSLNHVRAHSLLWLPQIVWKVFQILINGISMKLQSCVFGFCVLALCTFSISAASGLFPGKTILHHNTVNLNWVFSAVYEMLLMKKCTTQQKSLFRSILPFPEYHRFMSFYFELKHLQQGPNPFFGE